MRDRPTVRPLGGAEVLVAVRGPSPGEGRGKKREIQKKWGKVNYGNFGTANFEDVGIAKINFEIHLSHSKK